MKKTLFGKIMTMSIIIELIMLLMMVLAFRSFKLNERKDAYIKMEILMIESGSLRLELLLRRDSSFTELFELNTKMVLDNLRKFDNIHNSIHTRDNEDKLHNIKKRYKNSIVEYTELLREFGLNENDGIEGRFREKIHEIEEYLKIAGSERVYLYLLQARRREKDFIMRNRHKYADNVNSLMKELQNELPIVKDLNAEEKIAIAKLADGYITAFNEFVIITSKISESEKTMLKIEKDLKIFLSEIVKKEIEAAENYQASLIPLFMLSVIISVILSIIVARSITKPLVSLKNATIKVSKGDFKIKVKIKSRDEIGDLAMFFNEMTENIQKANETILNQQYTLNFQNNELKEINATKDKFFSIIAHDLKNPLSAFMNVSEFLTKTFQELSREEIKDFLDAVNSSAKGLYELLENLLLWSRTQRGQIKYHPSDISISSFVLNNLELLKVNADNKNIKLTYQESEDSIVYADPNMLNTILRNLISNAIKFTHENGNIDVYCIEQNGFSQITVKDSGVGIPEDNLKALFKMESSVSTAGTRQETGTGLGLILCYEFVKCHGGKIWVDSEFGKGSQFHFTLPIYNEAEIIIDEN